MFLLANIFQPLIDVFESVLQFFHNSLGVPWGWAIVLLTVAMRLVLLPLTVKQFHSMQALQRLQPELKQLQQKYKDDKQRQQQEMMKFYKENNVNPLGSCLPMVLQLPVFISLFYMLRKNLREDICPAVQAVFRHHYMAAHHVSAAVAASHTRPCYPSPAARFLFIPDLTNNSHGIVLIVLMVLYIGTQLASSMMMATPTMDPMQRRIMMFMPLIFVFFIFRFPAGLLVYWITTNAWTMGQQFVLRRRLMPPVTAGPAGVGGPALTDGSVSAGSSTPASGNGGGGKAAAPPPPKRTKAANSQKENGASAVATLGGLLRGRTKVEEAAPESKQPQARATVPPPSPRKKKKRSGRRR